MIGIISGIGKTTLPNEILQNLNDIEKIETPFGNVESIKYLTINQKKVVFLFRHGIETLNLTAPFVNYKANIYALKEIGVERIISLNTVGAINPAFEIGDFIIPHDFVDFTKNRNLTFFENKGYGHIRMNPPFCPELRKILIDITKKYYIRTFTKGLYFCFEGPRLETVSEINIAKYLNGDIVGMTLVPEVILARELELCYASLCYVINYAEGTYFDENGNSILLPEKEKEKKDKLPFLFYEILKELVLLIPDKRLCPCKDAMLNYKSQKIINDDWHTWI